MCNQKHTATHVIHCNTPQRIKSRVVSSHVQIENTLQHTAHTLQHTATPWITLQRTATHCNTLQHRDTATHCNTLHHIATHSMLQSLRLVSENADNAFSSYPASKRTHSRVSSNSENTFSATKQAIEHILGYQAIQRTHSRAIKSLNQDYEVASTSRLLKIIGLLCKRAL